MLKKLIVVCNPRSSRAGMIEREVLEPARKLRGWLVGKYEVQAIGVDENAEQLAKILDDGDLVIVAGGDGTAAIALNATVLSDKDVSLAVMGYGNFNDMARLTKVKLPVEYGDGYVGGIMEIVERYEAGKVMELHPLEVWIDGKHWRYAGCYVTLGLFAESTAVFDQEKVRLKLREKRGSLVFSVWQLVKWYFRHRKEEFLPIKELRRLGNEGMAVRPDPGTTDYLAVNGPRVARVMRGGKYYLRSGEFLSATARLGGFWRLMWFMFRSMLWRIPGKKSQKDVLTFGSDARVMIQAEGECEELVGIQKIEIGKVGKVVKMVR